VSVDWIDNTLVGMKSFKSLKDGHLSFCLLISVFVY